MKVIKILFISVMLTMTLNGFSQNLSKGEKPNIIFILADDLTRWDVGCYGSVDSKTPTIDGLAASGMKFNKCYQASPMCSPTRHSLLTGMYPVRTGAYPNHTFAKEGTKSIVHYLEPLGYRVALSGKRHILPKKVFPFEYLDGENGKTVDPDLNRIDGFLNDVTLKKDNFCLFVNFKSPHAPWTQGDRSLFNKEKLTLPPYLADLPDTREGFKNYLAEINYLDGQIKETLDLLKKYGQDKNTMVIFATEQGNSMPFAKWTLYNAGVGSGLIVNWPGKIKAGSETNALVEYLDIVPTMIDVAGGKPVDYLDGSSLLPVLFQEKSDHKEYTYALQTTRSIIQGGEYYPIRAISDGTYRLIVNLIPDIKFKNTVTSKDGYFKKWRTSVNPKDRELARRYENRPPIELYNDIEDPYNLNNLAQNDKYKKIIKRLRLKLEQWMSYCGDEGIVTEFEANLHTKHYLDKMEEEVSMHLDFIPNLQKGNFEVKHDGYYFFYSKGKKRQNKLMVDGKELFFGKKNEKTYANYGVVALKKGKHTLQAEDTLSFDWSGPNLKKTNLKDFILNGN